MTSKERVRITLACGQADRAPIDYLANPGINGRLMKHFGLQDDDREGLLQRLNVDFRGVGPAYKGKRLHAEIPGRRVNPMTGVRTKWIEHDSGGYWDICDFPLKDADAEAVAAWPLPTADDYDYSQVRQQCQANGQFGVSAETGFIDIINGNGMLRTMEQTLIDLITDDPAGLLLAGRRARYQIDVTARTLEAAGGGIDFLWLGEDLGTQIGPMISRDIFRKHILPHYKEMVDLGLSHGVPTMIHTCGSSSWAYEDFIAIGIKAVDTLQPEAKDMSPQYLKSHFGGRLAFHGCISTAGPVAGGTVQQTIDYCRQTLEIMMPGGGYCFSPTHALQDNSPTENVLAMYETALECGRYA
jgi:uroporphyrinogen decarboxylase